MVALSHTARQLTVLESSRPPLSPDALIVAIQTMRILALGHKLGASWSSFYWYFESCQDLLDQLLEYWRDKNIRLIIERAKRSAPSVTQAVPYATCLLAMTMAKMPTCGRVSSISCRSAIARDRRTHGKPAVAGAGQFAQLNRPRASGGRGRSLRALCRGDGRLSRVSHTNRISPIRPWGSSHRSDNAGHVHRDALGRSRNHRKDDTSCRRCGTPRHAP